MSNYSFQFEQIKTLITSPTKPEKSFAYSTLQHLQEQSSNDDSLIQPLFESTETLVSTITEDIRDSQIDDEILMLALKCLGFLIYHPSLVTAISKEHVGQVLESLSRLITTTKVKLVCNLGVWCISIQQLDASYLVCHFDSLLMAIVHSLDNPFGSLSTTFEAIQAIMKLATQINEKMRDVSSMWCPPIYRRLLSADKREKEMCLRCLLKIKSVIIPPPLLLSKAIAQDMKLRLLPGMKELLKNGKKVQAVHAWGWFICILGSYSMKTRHLVNDMLKVPEQAFSDPDPQIQISSLVAWESLIDALVSAPLKVCDSVTIHPHQVENKAKCVDTSEVSRSIPPLGGYSKSLKLIMTPLLGIMTSKADTSVQSSCLNTWCYLLHKLGCLVNDPQVLDKVVEPMFKVVFNLQVEERNIQIWRFSINLLEDFIEAKIGVDHESLDNVSCHLSARANDSGSPVPGEASLKSYCVKWLPWDSSQMDFLIRIIQMVFNQVTAVTSCLESRRLVSDAVLRMFHLFLKGVQMDFAKPLTTYNTVMQSLNTILTFGKMVCEAAIWDDDANNDFQVTCLQILESVTQELDPSILGSPLYKVSLDLKYFSDLRDAAEDRFKMLMGTSTLGSMDMVTPMVYVTVLYFSLVVRLSHKAFSRGCIPQEAYNYFSNLLSAYDSLEVIHSVVPVLYSCIEHGSLFVWTTIAKTLRDYHTKDLLPSKIQPSTAARLSVCHFLLYPYVFCSLQKSLKMLKHCESLAASPISSEILASEQFSELWVSLYCIVNSSHREGSPRLNSLAEELCSSLNDMLQRINTSEGVTEFTSSDICENCHFLSLSGDIAKCILENLHTEKVTPDAIKCGYTGSSGVNCCLEFTARVLKLLWAKNGAAPADAVISRLLPSLTHFAGHLQWQEDIVVLFKALCDPLLHWLSDAEMKSTSINHQLQLLWIEIIRSLQRSWPAIEFDSSFLKLQAPLLEKTLDHPSSSISDPTTTFWNSAYGDQIDLDIPPSLLQVLDKLSRFGKIKIRGRSASVLARDEKNTEVVSAPERYKVPATLNKCSKRVELVENKMDYSCMNKLPPCPKKKESGTHRASEGSEKGTAREDQRL